MACVPPLGFIGRSAALSLRITTRWRSMRGKKLLPLHTDWLTALLRFLNVMYRWSFTMEERRIEMLLDLPPSPFHCIAFAATRQWLWTGCSTPPSRQGEPRANEVVKWQRTYRALLSVCCFVVPLRDLDLLTTFNAASFCVAFIFFFTVEQVWRSYFILLM